MKTEQYFQQKLLVARANMIINTLEVIAQGAIAIALWTWLRGGL